MSSLTISSKLTTISRLIPFTNLSRTHHNTIKLFTTLSLKPKLIPQKTIHTFKPLKSSFSSANYMSTTSRTLRSNDVFMDDLVVLGIETSCDDTAAAVVSKLILDKNMNDVVFAKMKY